VEKTLKEVINCSLFILIISAFHRHYIGKELLPRINQIYY
jgi:hypothetical protein